MPATPKHLSFSSASTFAQCPKQWKTVYIDKKRSKPTMQTELGTLVHETLEHVMQQPTHNRTLQTAKTFARQAWDNFTATETYHDLTIDEKEWQQFRWRMWNTLTRLWDLEKVERINTIACEQKISAQLGNTPFFGMIDRVDNNSGSIIINDYKTGAPPNPRYENKNIKQALLYAAAWEHETGQQPTKTTLIYLAGSGQKISTTVTDDNLNETIQWLNIIWSQILDSIQNDIYTPQTSPLCGWCPALADCAEGINEVRSRLQKNKNVGPGKEIVESLDKETM